MKTRDKDYKDGFKAAVVAQRSYFNSNNDGNRKNHKGQYHVLNIPVVCDGVSHDVRVVFRSNKDHSPMVTCRAYHYDKVEDGEFDLAMHALADESPKCVRVAKAVTDYLKNKKGSQYSETITEQAFKAKGAVGGYEDNAIAERLFQCVLGQIADVRVKRSDKRRQGRNVFYDIDRLEPRAVRELAKSIYRINPLRVQGFAWSEKERLVGYGFDDHRPSWFSKASCCYALKRTEARHFKTHWKTNKHKTIWTEEKSVDVLAGHMGVILEGMDKDRKTAEEDAGRYRSDWQLLEIGYKKFDALAEKLTFTTVLERLKAKVVKRIIEWEKEKTHHEGSMWDGKTYYSFAKDGARRRVTKRRQS